MSRFVRLLRSRLLPALVALGVGLTTAGPSVAQSRTTAARRPPPEDPEAKRHFDTGLKLFKSKAFEAARTEFLESYRIGSRPSALRNAAQCERELKDFARAYETYERLLEEHGATLSAKDRRGVERALRDLASVTASLDVRVAPNGTRLVLDGQPIGTTPLPAPRRLNVGTHTLEMSREDFEPATRTFSAVAKQLVVVDHALVEEPRIARITLRERSGADVRLIIDDKEVGSAPWEGDLEEGTHVVELRGPRAAAPLLSLQVLRKRPQEITLDAFATTARVRVALDRDKATLTLDDRNLAQGPWEGDIAPGTHTFQARWPDGATFFRTVEARSGELLELRAERPAPVAPPAEATTPWGIYGRFDATAAFATEAAPLAFDPPPGPSRVTTPPAGALGFRLGYIFSWFGVELATAGVGFAREEFVDVRGAAAVPGQSISKDSPVARTEEIRSAGAQWLIAPGIRVASHGSLRFTAGVAPGFSYRSAWVWRSVSGGVEGTSTMGQVSATSFGMMADAGIYWGATPGVKLWLGANLFLDTPPDLTVSGTGPFVAVPGVSVQEVAVPVLRGTQIFVGPSLGLAFGH